MKNDLDKYGYRRRARKDFNLWEPMDEPEYPEPHIEKGGPTSWIIWGLVMSVGVGAWVLMIAIVLM